MKKIPILFIALLITSPAFAQMAKIQLKSGEIVEGTLLGTDTVDSVEIQVGGETVSYPLDKIEDIERSGNLVKIQLESGEIVEGNFLPLQIQIGEKTVNYPRDEIKSLEIIDGVMEKKEGIVRTTRTYFTNKRDDSYIFYKGGKEIASQNVKYDEDLGEIISEQKGEIPDGVVLEYLGPLGKIRELPYKDNRLNGTSRIYEEGVLRSESEYKDGKLEGLFRAFHKNGNLMVEATHKNEKLVGSIKTYYDNGELKLESFNDEKGRCHGERKTYFRNGTLESITICQEGEWVGIGKDYYESGVLKAERFHENGKQVLKKEYDEKGNLISENKDVRVPADKIRKRKAPEIKPQSRANEGQ